MVIVEIFSWTKVKIIVMENYSRNSAFSKYKLVDSLSINRDLY